MADQMPAKLLTSASNLQPQSPATTESARSPSSSSSGPPRSNSSSSSAQMGSSGSSSANMPPSTEVVYVPTPSTKDCPYTDHPNPVKADSKACPLISTTMEFDGTSGFLPLGAHLTVKPTSPNSTPVTVTAGPTIFIGAKMLILTASPLTNEKWRETSETIAVQSKKRKNPSGKGLVGLRNSTPDLTPGSKPRAGSVVVDSVKSSLQFWSAIENSDQNREQTREQTREKKEVGRVWLCNQACQNFEDHRTRKRDWALIELDPNVIDVDKPRNKFCLPGLPDENGKYNDGEWKTIRGATKGPDRNKTSLSKTGNEVYIIGMGCREATIRTETENMFGYDAVWEVELVDTGETFRPGDAGCSVVDKKTCKYLGMVVMGGKGRRGFYVPFEKIIGSMGAQYPLDFWNIGDVPGKSDLGDKPQKQQQGEGTASV